MKITTRQAEPADIGTLAALMRALAAHHGDTIALSDAEIRRMFFGARRAATALIAEADGQAVGYAAIVPRVQIVRGEQGVEVQHLFVRPDRRGRGIGRALLDAAGSAAAAEGGRYLVIGTHPMNRDAQAAYRRMGLEDVPESGPRFFRKLGAAA